MPLDEPSAAASVGAATAESDSRLLRRPWVLVGALATVAAGLGWLPFVWRGLSPDEGGLLMLAAQWEPGSSLYGDYWVDRPPVLIGLFAAADWLGGAAAVRAIGIMAVIATILLAGVIGRLSVRTAGAAMLLPAATAAVFVATPLFGGSVVNGELLGLPFVLAGIAAALAALSSRSRGSALAWAVSAGAAGAAAFLVKQSIVDVFVFGVALVATHWRPSSGPAGPVGPARSALDRLTAGAVGGAVAMTALVVWFADVRGTGLDELWEAVIVFRGEASSVIAQSATVSTAGRLGGVILALVGSGAPMVALALAWVARRKPAPAAGDREFGIDLRWPAYALIAWEAFVVLGGGSYWLHYLMGLVPGLVVLAAAAAQRQPPVRSVMAAYGFAAASALVAIGLIAVAPIERPETPAIAYLEDHVRPGDTGIVAFGAANIMEATGLESPYPYLWSLPVRVRDPELHALADVLAGPEAPTWLVLAGKSLTTWGVDTTAADEYVDERYTRVTGAGQFTIYRRSDLP